MTAYKPRENSRVLLEAVENMPVVVLSGMRQSGKSTLLQHLPEFAKRRYITFDDFNTLEAAKRSPDALLAGEEPVTIDEAQKFPEILSVIKRKVDRNRKPGQFILSGSANFLLLKSIAESLAGRAVYLTLYPFSRREILGMTGAEPALIHFVKTGRFPKRNFEPIHWRDVVMGGMPTVCLKGVKQPQVWFRGYEQTYLERDIRSLSQVGDLISFRNLLHLVALRDAQILKQSELARDAKLNVMTTSRYLSLMEASFILFRLPPHLRNRTSRLVKSSKVYLSDTGLAAFLTGERTIEEHEMLKGALWENYILQNMQSILAAHCPDAAITYWNIQGRYEVDFIIEIENKTVAIEVKRATRFHDNDLAGLKAYLASSKKCLGGLLAYNGTEILKLAERIWAVPAGLLLS
jgi:predicted AAA+ superfamily ATPase